MFLISGSCYALFVWKDLKVNQNHQHTIWENKLKGSNGVSRKRTILSGIILESQSKA